MTPDDRKYVSTHEWVMVDEDIATVGITDHAQGALGDITFVELPSVGDSVKKGEEAGVIESVKAASDVYTPIDGEIREVNSALEDSPEIINQDPYGDGWIFRLSNIDEAQLEDLMSAAEYEQGPGDDG